MWQPRLKGKLIFMGKTRNCWCSYQMINGWCNCKLYIIKPNVLRKIVLMIQSMLHIIIARICLSVFFLWSIMRLVSQLSRRRPSRSSLVLHGLMTSVLKSRKKYQSSEKHLTWSYRALWVDPREPKWEAKLCRPSVGSTCSTYRSVGVHPPIEARPMGLLPAAHTAWFITPLLQVECNARRHVFSFWVFTM